MLFVRICGFKLSKQLLCALLFSLLRFPVPYARPALSAWMTSAARTTPEECSQVRCQLQHTYFRQRRLNCTA